MLIATINILVNLIKELHYKSWAIYNVKKSEKKEKKNECK